MENKTKKLPHRRHYYNKLLRSTIASFVVLFFSLGIGVLGYHYFFEISWIDSLYNASMILTGMGPVNAAPSDGAKLFASFYAIYSGVAFLSSVAMMFSPIVHRFLHRFRLDVEQ